MANPRPKNIVHISQDDIDKVRTWHVTESQSAILSAVIGGWYPTTPTSGTTFYFGSGGNFSVSSNGKNLIYTNIDGSTAQITNFS